MEESRPECQYLKQALGGSLVEGLSQVVLLQPRDPVEFLAQYLIQYRRRHPLPNPPPLPKSLTRTVTADSMEGNASTVKSNPPFHLPQPQPPAQNPQLPPPSLFAPASTSGLPPAPPPPPFVPPHPGPTQIALPRVTAEGEDVDPISFDCGDLPMENINPDLFVHLDTAASLRQIGDIVDDDDCFDNG